MKFLFVPFITIIGMAESALAASVPSPSTATDFFFRPYIGADYQYVGVNYEDNIGGSGINGDQVADDSLHGANVHIGARMHKNLGFEFGYLTTGKGDRTNVAGTAIDTKTSVSGFNLDALGYLPLDDSGKLELIGTVGISRLKAELEASAPGLGTGTVDETETKPRVGIGAQYWITDNINARGIVRYQGAEFDGFVKSAVTANLGVNFQF